MTTPSKFGALQARIASFGAQEDGAVAMIFALATIPFCMSVALAVDYTRAVHMNQKFTVALDTATIAAAKLVRDGTLSDAEIKDQALSLFKENVKGNYAVFSDTAFDLQINRATSRVDITLPAYVPTTFARIGGFERMTINQAASAVFALRDVEVGIALDVTGSMNTPVGGKKKIDSLKSSFEKFAKLMIPDTPVPGQKTRMGLAPYAASVNLGTFASTVSGGASGDGCVVERSAALSRYTDAAPGGLDVFQAAAPGARDIDPTPAGRYECITPRLQPLTADRDELVRQVNAYSPMGNWTTAGHMGAHWAWNLISPTWGTIWGGDAVPASYTDPKVIKAVILMTDGEFNTAFNNTTSAAQARALCDNIKNGDGSTTKDKVQVFTIGFGLGGNATALATLRYCATPGDDYFVDAANEQDLDDAFAKFAGKINALRLAR